MTTRYRLSPPALDRLAEIVGDDGCATAEEIERALSASTSTTSTTTTGEPDEAYARRALAAMGIEEDDGRRAHVRGARRGGCGLPWRLRGRSRPYA